MFKPIGVLLGGLAKHSKSSEVILALQVRHAAKDCLKKECRDMPDNLIDLVKVASYKNGTLKLIAPSLVCAELQMRSGGLTDGINRRLGRKLVFRIRLKGS